MNFDDGILYEHNIEAYKKLMEAIARKGKACAIHSTGTGKMYLALKWLLDNRGESFAYVAPTNVILDKFLDIVIDTCFKDKVDVFEKCNSIESKAKKVSELFGNSDIHLLTYQGLHEKMKNGKKEVLVNHIVLDEFHHCGADQWGSSVEKFIKTNNQTELIGLSATPIRNDGVDMVDELFGGVIDSKITLKDAINRGILPVPNFIGAIYSFEEEIDNQDNRLKGKSFSLETQNKIEKNIKEAKKMVEDGNGIREIFDLALTQVKDSNDVKFIVFCSDIDDMRKKMSEAKKWFDIDKKMSIRSVSYAQSKKNNLDTIKEFEEDKSEGIKLLFSIDMLNEGLHVDDIDGVIMMRPTESKTIFLQQLGRALAAGSKKGIKPLILDLVNNVEILNKNIDDIEDIIIENKGKVFDEYSFKDFFEFSIQAKILEIIDYLKGVKYTFEERIAPLIAYYKAKGSIASISEREEYRYGSNDIKIGVLVGELRKSYKLRFLSKEELEEKRRLTDGKCGRPLTDLEVKVLEKMGMKWAVNSFEERIAPLVDYYNKNNSLLYIVDTTEYMYQGEKINLGALVGRLRGQYRLRELSGEELKKLKEEKKATMNPLTDEQVEILERMGMEWDVISFEKRIAPLVDYYNKNNNSLSGIVRRTEHVYKGKKIKIGELVGRLRLAYDLRKFNEQELENYKKVTGITAIPLTDEQVEMLERMGMEWDVSSFEKRIAPLVDYYNKNNSLSGIVADTTYMYKGEKINLGLLVSRLRGQYRLRELSEEELRKLKEEKTTMNPLTDEQVEMLERMGMEWDVSRSFKNRIAPLIDYYKKNGTIADVKTGQKHFYSDKYINIGEILNGLRKSYKLRSLSEEELNEKRIQTNGKCGKPLTDEQVQMLEKIGIVWSPSKKTRK